MCRRHLSEGLQLLLARKPRLELKVCAAARSKLARETQAMNGKPCEEEMISVPGKIDEIKINSKDETGPKEIADTHLTRLDYSESSRRVLGYMIVLPTVKFTSSKARRDDSELPPRTKITAPCAGNRTAAQRILANTRWQSSSA